MIGQSWVTQRLDHRSLCQRNAKHHRNYSTDQDVPNNGAYRGFKCPTDAALAAVSRPSNITHTRSPHALKSFLEANQLQLQGASGKREFPPSVSWLTCAHCRVYRSSPVAAASRISAKSARSTSALAQLSRSNA